MSVKRTLLVLVTASFCWTASFAVYAADAESDHPPTGGNASGEKTGGDPKHDKEGHQEHANTNPLAFDPDLAIFTLIVFVLLLTVLGKFAWKPIMAALEKREQGIASQIEEAKQSAEQAQQTLQQYQGQLAAAADEVKQLMAEARRDAESAKDRILTEAQAAAERERERALSDIEAAKNKALGELAQKSVDTAVALAGRLVRKEIKADDHAQLIQESLQQFPSRN